MKTTCNQTLMGSSINPTNQQIPLVKGAGGCSNRMVNTPNSVIQSVAMNLGNIRTVSPLERGWGVLNLTLTLVLALITSSCTNTEETIPVGGKPLQVSVTSTAPSSRALVESTLLPNNAVMGVTLVAKDGSTYDTDVNDEYNNLQYATTDGETFTTASAPLLTYNEAKAAAYYPYSSSATDVTAIPINTASQTDYMYSGWYTGLDESNPQAKFNMKHALAAVRLLIQKDADYTPAATLTAVKAQSNAFYASATLDATSANGTLSGLTGAGATVQNTSLNQALSTTATTVDFMVVPGTSAADITFTATIGGKDYVATAENVTLQQGAIHSYTLTLTPQGMSVTNTTVQPWTTINKGTLTLEKVIPNVSKVYAVRKSDKALVEVDDIDTDNEEYIAVALHVTGNDFEQKFMIEKNETKNTTSIKAAYTEDGATNTGYEKFYWGMFNLDNTSITNYTQTGGGGTLTYGYLPKADGTYQSTPNLSGDYTTWTSGALSDFNGKENTAALLEASDTDSYTTFANMATWCRIFNQTATENQGYTDWYIPACGQLSLMYLNMTEINAALTKIGGQTIASNYYWSSSEYDSAGGWNVLFSSGRVGFNTKNIYNRVRFVRDF